MKEDNSMINPQSWLLKTELVKKKNNLKGLLLILIVFLISLLVISHLFTNDGSQMRLIERLNMGFITGSNLSPISFIWLSESYYG
jgi:hypothetical protein|tara:strand:+ start:613 stop:867 length:255 start_codon:yes stop_codon:yes gene_type:complete